MYFKLNLSSIHLYMAEIATFKLYLRYFQCGEYLTKYKGGKLCFHAD